MMTPEQIAMAAITLLGGLAIFLAKFLARNWGTRIAEHEARLNDHDVQIATVQANIEHIRETGDETRKDVKQLLRYSNGGTNRTEERR